jgi:para-nitrobenzyl esterase
VTGPEVETADGRIRGRRHAGVLRFDGIPFARPPLGPLRFRPPEPPEPWAGVHDATFARPAPLQRPGPALGTRPVGATAEDCLHLNVVTPALDGRRPVLVWIHGGGFVNGAASDPIHAGERLVARGDVVLVTLDYRLGLFGFLHGRRGTNVGLQDQLTALRWVRAHADRFGGDAGRVTLFGESAGAMSILALLAAPEADDLFRAAVLQSAAAGGTMTAEEAERVRAALAAELGTEDEERWAGLPADRLLDAQAAVAAAIRRETGRSAFRPLVDGTRVLGDAALAVTRARNATRPLLLGSNADEQRLYVNLRRPPSRDEAARRLALGLRRRTEAPVAAAHAVLAALEARHPGASEAERLACAETDLYYRLPALELARLRQDHGPSWNYLFRWPSPALRGRLGACHALEIPFVFGTLDAPGMDRFAGTGPAAERLSSAMIDGWSAFARAGDPAVALPGWRPWEPLRRTAWIADAEPACEDDPDEAERRLWCELLPELRC